MKFNTKYECQEFIKSHKLEAIAIKEYDEDCNYIWIVYYI